MSTPTNVVKYSGGSPTTTTVGSETILTFTDTSRPITIQFDLANPVKVLVVGGGGGGGGAGNNRSGGGGGGGVTYNSSYTFTNGSIFTLNVGAGGDAGNGSDGGSGYSSYIGSLTAGGGEGGLANRGGYGFGSTGGSSGNGNAGGTDGGGGGGAGGAGASGGGYVGPSTGGIGVNSDITGNSIYYGGGGGGGATGGAGGAGGGGAAGGYRVTGTSGTNGLGGGGGGTGGYNPGGAGGSGVIIIRGTFTASQGLFVLQSSGKISLSDIQSNFGGSDPISLNEYYAVDSGVPSSGTVSVNQFYGRSKQWVASYTSNIVAYTIPLNAGGIGEGFYRTAADWYNGTDRQGQVRLHGIVGIGNARGYGTKITGYALYVDGVVKSSYSPTFGGPAFHSWDVISYVSRGSYVYLSVYAWGAFNADRVRSGNFYVGAG